MRDTWYGDKRDLVKWATLIHVARANRIGVIIQVALYVPDNVEHRLRTPGGCVAFPKEVLAHFRNVDEIQGLSERTGITIDVVKSPFRTCPGSPTTRTHRDHYFSLAMGKLQKYADRPVIFFLDPDTGIAPKKCSYKHVRPGELSRVFAGLRADDILVFYQHGRSRTDRDWVANTRREFAEAVGATDGEVNTFTSRVAADVAFFAVKKRPT